MTTATAIIPARYASQRLPGKPLALIGTKPMIMHVYERAAQATLVADVLVATDDQRIADAVHGFGGKAVMTSPALQSGTDRIAHAAQGMPPDAVIVNVQGDEPLIAPGMIDEAIRVVTEQGAEAGTLVRAIEHDGDLHNPNVVKVVLGKDGHCLYFSRAAVPFGRDHAAGTWLRFHTYYRHCGLYVFRNRFLQRYVTLPQTPLERAEKLEQLRILEHGFSLRAAVTMHDSVAVDTQSDLEHVRLMYEHQHEQH